MSREQEKHDKANHVKGQIHALRTLANEVRLECSRNHMPMQAAAIKMMQDALLQIHRMGTEGGD